MILLSWYSSFIEAACDQEISNSQLVARRIANEWPLRSPFDSKTQYVQRIVDLLMRAITLRMQTRNFDWPLTTWKILLVRDLSVNAYSIGNGRIYLTDGTIASIQNEAELAAIIAHEMSHQLMGHFCKDDNSHTEYSIGSLVQVLDNNKEMEADALAVEILQQANFPARAMLAVVQKSPTVIKNSTHKQIRISTLKQQLRGIKYKPFYSSPEFLQFNKKSSP
jgi:predicted Zn-dependent protease